ncbi:uncharacterized protein LOC134259054, partial [Saccostrea cucullata]|uniref:uncharacterized protein LOC134259054 n=1 Tax=Saccostrea cuccullata TaxID=36930 RepID=UPI002ED32DC3
MSCKRRNIQKDTDTDTALETLEVRFLDQEEHRIQRMFSGSSAMEIKVECISTLEDWMQIVASSFKTKFSMHPVLLKDGKYEQIPSGTTLSRLRQKSKGKHKHFGFYVKVDA